MRIKTVVVAIALVLGLSVGGVLSLGTPFAHAVVSYINVNPDYFPELIDSYRVDARVNQDGTVLVTETIKYDFKEEHKHGIRRTIPVSRAPGALKPLTYKDVSVVNEYGTPYYVLDESKSDQELDIRIGDPDVLVTGIQFYVLSYTIHNAIGFFDDRDELYWNATGNEWNVPIRQVETHITIPGVYRENTNEVASYCGPRGSRIPCMTLQPFYHEDTATTEFIFSTEQESFLDVGSGMTVAVGFPKGVIPEPTLRDRVIVWLERLWFIPFPFLFAGLWFRKSWAAYRERKQYSAAHPLMVEYDAAGFTPLEIAALVRGTIQPKDISAELISLAVRGYLVIKNNEGEYTFTATAQPIDDLPLYDKTIMLGVQDMTTTTLRASFVTKTPTIIKTVVDGLVSRGLLYKAKRFEVSNPWMVFFISLFLAINPGVFVWTLLGYQAGMLFSLTCVLIGIGTITGRPRQFRLTEDGLGADLKLRGLELYIRVAEADRITFHNAPAKNPALFESLLPYAMIFGLEEKWAAEFEGLYTQPPTWYVDPGMHAFSAATFNNRISSFAAVASSSLFTPLPGSSGSHSGSSGSGSSGGGGGGGGGGSW